MTTINTFKHSGDLGDIIYSLPTIKKLGGGVLYLDISGGINDSACINQCLDKKTKFNLDAFNFIKPLLKEQNYIKDVLIYNNENIKYNLNEFRNKFNSPTRNKNKNLVDLHLETFNLSTWSDNDSWLTINSNPVILNKKTLINRTSRYTSNYSWFFSNKYNISKKAIFIGLPKEHEYFEWTFDIKIDYHPVNNALDIARILLGCNALVCNQSFILSVAIGLGSVSIVQEVDPRVPNCVFQFKRNMSYI